MEAHLIYQGDCLDVLPQLPDGVADMVFADLPYGVTRNKWDSVIPFAPLWAELLRVGKKNAAFVFTATQPFATALINSQPRLFRYDLIWDKRVPVGFLNANRAPLRRHEHVLLFGRGAYNPQKSPGDPYGKQVRRKSTNYGTVINETAPRQYTGGRFPVSLLSYARQRKDWGHPTQKPVALLEWLIKTYSHTGDTVLDPTMGSGTTGAACIATGRRFIGIEQDRKYFRTTQKRMNETRSAHGRTSRSSTCSSSRI